MINLINGIASTSSALNAERVRMEVISQNIANANSTSAPGGKTYERQQVVFESALRDQLNAGNGVQAQTVQVSRIETAKRPPRLVYQPGHPHANADGMVAMPNINIHEELVDLMSASRAYEANLSVVKSARNMALQTLSIGKR